MNFRRLLISLGALGPLILLIALGWLVWQMWGGEAGDPAATGTAVAARTVPSQTPSRTAIPTVTATLRFPEALRFTPTGTATPSPTPSATPTPTPLQSNTPSRTPTPAAATLSPTPALTRTPTPSPTGSSTTAALRGRVVRDGTPVGAGIVLIMEDQASQAVAEVTTGPQGGYTFTGLDPSAEGYNLVFTQENNEALPVEGVLSLAWVGPIPLEAGDALELPDLDISLQGFQQQQPAPGASVSAAGISPSDPLEFSWGTHPAASQYWVDLLLGEDQVPVWGSFLSDDPSATFDGQLVDGSQVEPGDYWWGIGAEGELGEYDLTVYGALAALTITP